MKTKGTRHHRWPWVAGVVVLLGACTKPPISNLTPTPLLPTATATRTINPSLTPTKTPTQTWTSVPTLPPDQAQITVNDLYSHNGGCEFPCWWGITPGETTWQYANDLLAPLGRISSPIVKRGIALYEVSLPRPASFTYPRVTAPGFDDRYFSPSIFAQDGIVWAINLNAGWISPEFDSTLSGLLRRFGQPDEIWMQVNTDAPPENGPPYYIDLFYPTKGVLLDASGIAERRGDVLRICPRNLGYGGFPPGIALWVPGLDITYQDTNVRLFGDILSWKPSEYHLLEDLTVGFGSAKFYETYREAGATECFEITP